MVREVYTLKEWVLIEYQRDNVNNIIRHIKIAKSKTSQTTEHRSRDSNRQIRHINNYLKYKTIRSLYIKYL